MYLRQLLPKWLRWRMALRWVARAEVQEDLADVFAGEPLEDRYGQNAIAFYVKAWKWYPMQHVGHMPSPDNLGEHPVDEQLWPEGTADVQSDHSHWPTIECVICGKSIPRARAFAGDGTGLYCDACA